MHKPAVLDSPPAVGVANGSLVPPQLVPAASQTIDDSTQPRSFGFVRKTLAAIGSSIEWVFGVVSLIGGLAILATIPIFQLLSLGYLLEVSGRIARTGRLRAGFIGVRKAARVGGVVLAVWALFWPLRLVSSLWFDARLIDPASPAVRNLHTLLVVLSVLVLSHIASACLRDGRLRRFIWPRPIHFVRQLFRRGTYAQARDGLWNFVVSLRLPYYFWLGARGFLGAVVWLVIPVSLLAASSQLEGGGPLVGLIGGALMVFVLMYLPFLQTRFAAENRLGAMFELRENRRHFARAPIAFFVALVFTLALALPLYLLKIEIIPREAAWLPSLLFVMSIFPARLLTGWAYARSSKRTEPRLWLFRLATRLGMLPVVAFYVLIVYFTQYLSWYGVWSLYEQHAFLVPVPFLEL